MECTMAGKRAAEDAMPGQVVPLAQKLAQTRPLKRYRAGGRSDPNSIQAAEVKPSPAVPAAPSASASAERNKTHAIALQGPSGGVAQSSSSQACINLESKAKAKAKGKPPVNKNQCAVVEAELKAPRATASRLQEMSAPSPLAAGTSRGGGQRLTAKVAPNAASAQQTKSLSRSEAAELAKMRTRNHGELPQEQVEVITTGTVEPPWVSRSRAKLLKMELENFRIYRKQTILLRGTAAAPDSVCIVGTNSCGKTTILDAITFAMLRPLARGRTFLDLVRRSKGEAACRKASVALSFDCKDLGWVWLQREVTLTGESTRNMKYTVGSVPAGQTSTTWPPPLHQVSEKCYLEWITEALRWTGSEVILPQFGLLEEKRVPQILATLPDVLVKAAAVAEDEARPLLKRRSLRGAMSNRTCIQPSLTAEAYLGRRLDEIFRELKREPLDADMTEWGEGGQACLRRLEDGSFTIYASQQRGYAACGYGAEYKDLADGDRDLLSLSLLLALSGLEAGQQDTLPAFVILDEPDSRLDKQHAVALQRLMSGPSGPKQCIIMSLNNHGMFDEAIHLDEVIAAAEQ